MSKPTKVVQPHISNFFISTAASLGLILSYWLLFYSLTCMGCWLPKFEMSRFYDLGFFAFSSFSFITFLAMIPFQRAEEKLSPGLFSRVIHTPWAHLGLYVLFFSSIACFVAIGVHQHVKSDKYFQELFFALLSSIITAIIFHRFWVLRYLYQPYAVYANIANLTEEEGIQEAWLELIECSYKTIGDKRLNGGQNFMNLLEKLYRNTTNKDRIKDMNEDLESVYKVSKDLRPLQRQMEKQWPFLLRVADAH